MSRTLGSTLPDGLWDLLSGQDLPARMGQAILITTADAEGWPHPALLSYGEVIAVDRYRLRLALDRTSRTSDNLRRNGKLTLCLVGPGGAYYVKTTAREKPDLLKDFALLAGFEVAVTTVLADQAREDLEPRARLRSGITFDPGEPSEQVLCGWHALTNALRSIP